MQISENWKVSDLMFFIYREKDDGSQEIVKVNGNTVRIENVKVSGRRGLPSYLEVRKHEFVTLIFFFILMIKTWASIEPCIKQWEKFKNVKSSVGQDWLSL